MKKYSKKHKSNLKRIVLELIVLFITSSISSLGGLSFQSIEKIIAMVLPIIIIFPSLNDLMGNFAIIFSSKFTTLLYKGKIKEKFAFDNKEIKSLLKESSIAGLQLSILVALFGIIMNFIIKKEFNLILSVKVIFISTIVVQIMLITLYLLVIFLGMYFSKKHIDPDDFLIPLSTSLADFLTMIYVAALTIILFAKI